MFLVGKALAANICNDPTNTLGSGSGIRLICPITTGSATTLGGLIALIIQYILYAASVLAVIYLLVAGIQYITAGGDAEKATKARTGIVNAIIGIIIIILALVVENVIVSAVGGTS